MTNRRRILLAALLLCGCQTPDHQRTAADRATYDWAAPMLTRYVTADPALDEQAKATHLRGLTAWDKRIKAHEAAK